MSGRQRLAWYTAAVFSFILIAIAYQQFGDLVLAADKTGITIGVTAIYVAMTLWLGLAIHTRGLEAAQYWCEWVVDLLPALGLIGTLIGISLLFGLTEGGSEAASLSALGTALFTTLAGLSLSKALDLQCRVCNA